MISRLYSNNHEDRMKELRMLSLKDRRIQFDMVQTFRLYMRLIGLTEEYGLSL